MKIEEAKALVEDYLRKSEIEINNFGSSLPNYKNPNIKLRIINEETEEHDFGWVFYYNSEEFLRTGNVEHSLVGNAPLIVDQKSQMIIETGTAQATDVYINNYKKYGDPHYESD